MKAERLVGKLLVLFAAIVGWIGLALANIEPRIALVERQTVRYHPEGANALSRFTTNHVGGVLSQARLSAKGSSTALENAYLTMPEPGEDYICIMQDPERKCLKLTVEYADLVPLAMWVATGATSAYTAFAELSDPDFLENAGFAEARGTRGYAAIEFVGTHYEDILYYIDFCNLCLGESQTEWVDAYNSRIDLTPEWQAVEEGLFTSRDRESSYINTDLNSEFTLLIDDDSAVLRGEPARYQWYGYAEIDTRKVSDIAAFESYESLEEYFQDIGDERADLDEKKEVARQSVEAALDAVVALDNPSTMVQQGLEEIRDSLESSFDLYGVALDAALEEGPSELAKHQSALRFFRIAALLRYFRDKDQDGWSSFLDSIQAGYETDREPWDRYADAYESVYGESPLATIQ